MKKGITLIVLIGLSIFLVSGQNSPQDKNWDTVFQDNFSMFNTSLWHKANNHVHGDSTGEEPQVYIQDDAYINYIDGSNKLVLRTRKLNSPYQWTNPSQHCPKGNNCWYSNNHYYTSGQINSNRLYKYGYFEIYAQLPSGTVFWPGFWLWKSEDTPIYWYNEIDIMEANGCEPVWTSCNYWCEFDYSKKHDPNELSAKNSCNYADGSYHWFGVEWDSDKITWYIDRKVVRQTVNNLWNIGIQNPLEIIINLALFPPSWNKCPLHTTLFSAYMYVAQANLYQLKYECDAIVNEILNYNTFNYAVKKSISLSSVSSLFSGENVSLRATDYIELESGFEVPLGAELYLDINPCE